MRKMPFVFVVWGLGAALAAERPFETPGWKSDHPDQPVERNQPGAPPERALKPRPGPERSAAPSANDRETLARLHHDNGVEIDLGQLAVAKGRSKQVQQLGQQLVADHREAERQLSETAGRLAVDLTSPEAPAAKQLELERRIERLKNLEGSAFDAEFAAVMVDVHREAVALTARALKTTPNPQLRALYGQLLPVLGQHLRLSEELPRDEVAAPPAASGRRTQTRSAGHGAVGDQREHEHAH